MSLPTDPTVELDREDAPDDRDELGLIGRTLGGCTIEGVLGRGGMGVVYRAHHAGLQRSVALKVLPQGFAGERQILSRFIREARTAAKITHPNLIQIYDVSDQDGVYYIQMELVEGKDLTEELLARGRLEPDEAARLVIDVCAGLTAAHRQGVIHRDIKPGNLMLMPDGRVKIADFGLARGSTGSSPDITRQGQIMGTPEYMSPEQCNGEAADARSDLYALGMSLYVMVTGQKAFVGTTAGLLVKQVSEMPVPPHEREPSVPRALSAIIWRLILKDPEARFQSAEELAEALEGFLEGRATGAFASLRPVTARRSAVTAARKRRHGRPPRRSLAPYVAVGVSGLVVALITLMALRGGGSTPAPPGPAPNGAGTPEASDYARYRALRSAGKREPAWAALSAHLAANESDWTARRELVELALELDRSDEAARHVQAFVVARRDLGWAYPVHARLLRGAGQLGAAVLALKKAIEIQDQPPLRVELARTYREWQRPLDALQELARPEVSGLPDAVALLASIRAERARAVAPLMASRLGQDPGRRQTITETARAWVEADPGFHLNQFAAALALIGTVRARTYEQALVHLDRAEASCPAPGSVDAKAFGLHLSSWRVYFLTALQRHAEALALTTRQLTEYPQTDLSESVLRQRYAAQFGLRQFVRAVRTLTLYVLIHGARFPDLAAWAALQMRHPSLGAVVEQASQTMGESYRLHVRVETASPSLPLVVGDRITAVDGAKMITGQVLEGRLSQLSKGVKRVRLTYEREGQTHALDVTSVASVQGLELSQWVEVLDAD